MSRSKRQGSKSSKGNDDEFLRELMTYMPEDVAREVVAGVDEYLRDLEEKMDEYLQNELK